MTSKLRTINKNSLFSIMLFISIYLIDLKYLISYGRTYLDSDMSAEMILADLENKEHVLISKNYFYSTEIRVIYQQFFYRIGLLLFPENWHMARILGMAIMLLLYALCILFLLSQIKPINNKSIITTTVLLLPFGYWYLYLVMFSGSYIPHLLVMLASTALMLLFAKNKYKEYQYHIIIDIVCLTTVIALALLGGLNGVRCLMNLFIPFFFAAALLKLINIRKHGKVLFSRHLFENRLLLASIIGLIASTTGYMINSVILSKEYVFENMTKQTWTDLSLVNLLKCWTEFLNSFGHQNSEYIISLGEGLYHNQTSPCLFSLEGVVSTLGILIAFAVVISEFRLLSRLFRMEEIYAFYTILFATIFVTISIAVSWTVGSDANLYYWVPSIPFAIIVIYLEIETEDWKLRHTSYILTIILLVCAALTGYCTRKHFIREPLRSNRDLVKVSEWLEENNYTSGYATFWNSDVLTELTNGKIEMWTVLDINDPDSSVYKWLQKKDHIDTLPDGKTFVLYGPNVTNDPKYNVSSDRILYEYGGIRVVKAD